MREKEEGSWLENSLESLAVLKESGCYSRGVEIAERGGSEAVNSLVCQGRRLSETYASQNWVGDCTAED